MRKITNDLSGWICQKNIHDKKVRFWDKKDGLTPLQNLDLLDSSKTPFIWSKKHSCLFRIPKNDLFFLNLAKKHT